MRDLLPLALIAGLAVSAIYCRAETKVSLKSVNVDLPTGDRMFPMGPGSEVTKDNCLLCHSAEMVLEQPALSKVAWEAEVNKMREAYKAPVDPKDVDAIVGYLVRINGRS